MTSTPEGHRPDAGDAQPQRDENAAAPQAPAPTQAVPQGTAPTEHLPQHDRTTATEALPATPAAAGPQDQPPVGPPPSTGHPQDAPTQRITPTATQAVPHAPAPQRPYPAPYQHGAPQQAAPHQAPYAHVAVQPAPAPQHALAGQGAATHDPLAAFRTPAPAGTGAPAGPGEPPVPGAGPAAPDGRPRSPRTRMWLPVVGVAAAAALLGSLGTAALTGAFDDQAGGGSRAADLSSIGRSESDTVPVSGSSAENPDWQAVASAVQASVVAIQVTTSNGGAEGSGVIVDSEGHVVTNNHVVSGAQDGQVQVTLTDGRIFTADVVGTDPTTDLAVIQLQDAPDDLSPATFGSVGDVAVGDPVMAVGNPLGLANTVTTGIVSALDRPVSTTESGASDAVVTNAIQIDAAVNPGNSGGPLFDAQGRVIGITSSIATTSSQSGSIGLGFAIPVDVVDMIAGQLIQDGTAEHAFLGVTLGDGTATADGVTRAGATVMSVSDGTPAAKAGLQPDDVIVAIDGRAVAGAESLTGYVRAHASGDEVTLTVVRDGKAMDVDVTLATLEATATADQGSGRGGSEQGEQQSPGQGSGGLEDMTPEQLWEWFQQQQGRG
ncbi:S1C family serine protease [Cellulomonas sp. C5510]|uniref:S1C family serine protease n=1 Tax=Cellulomonas sp. C5510 TaxID=2871170 RepID=UPI002103A2E5|nr:trypsin-like peptidase domain-containing protein [Cellulomonas sp. C5510]